MRRLVRYKFFNVGLNTRESMFMAKITDGAADTRHEYRGPPGGRGPEFKNRQTKVL